MGSQVRSSGVMSLLIWRIVEQAYHPQAQNTGYCPTWNAGHQLSVDILTDSAFESNCDLNSPGDLGD